MSCIGTSIPSLDALIEAVNRCGTAYGGSEWPTLALIGLATVVAFVLAFGLVFWIIKEMAHG